MLKVYRIIKELSICKVLCFKKTASGSYCSEREKATSCCNLHPCDNQSDPPSGTLANKRVMLPAILKDVSNVRKK